MRSSTAEMMASTRRENPIRIRFRQGLTRLASIPNAIPGFSVWTILNRPGIIVCESQSDRSALIRSFVILSSTKTRMAAANGKTRLPISFAQYFAHGVYAGGAQGREFGVLAHIRSVFPAALAFLALSAFDLNFECPVAGLQHHLGDDEQAREFVGIALEQAKQGIRRF